MSRPPVTIVVEGTPDEAAATKILEVAGCCVAYVYGLAGKAAIDRNLNGYNNAARHSPWFVLRDLDSDAECPGDLVTKLVAKPAKLMRFRIAVREVEAWFLADADAIATFLKIRKAMVPANPDDLDDPKGALLNLARRSRSSQLRDDLVPRSTSGREGPAYASRMAEFARQSWRPGVAQQHSQSLRRCLKRIKELSEYLKGQI